MEPEPYCAEQSHGDHVLNNETLNGPSSIHMLSPIIPNNGNTEIISNQVEPNHDEDIINTNDSSSGHMFSPIIPKNNNNANGFNRNYLQNRVPDQGANNAEENIKTFEELNCCFEKVNLKFYISFHCTLILIIWGGD